MLRLHEVINKKEVDYQNEINRLNDEKGSMWKDNQALGQ